MLDARYVIKHKRGKGYKEEPRLHYLEKVFDLARDGGDDWVEDRFYNFMKERI